MRTNILSRRRPAALLLVLASGLAVVALAFASNRDALAAPDDKPGPAKVPFTLLPSNHMVVQAKLNGKGPYRLIFDVGAPITLLSNRAAVESGAVDKNAKASFLFSMRGEGKVKDLQVGELDDKDLPVMVFDHPALKALSGFLSGRIDGIIGFTFFARYKTTIDYQAKVMTLEKVDYRVRNLIEDLPAKLSGPKVARETVFGSKYLFGIELGDPTDQGVTIASVRRESPAAAGGLRSGDVLVSLDGRWTTTAADAAFAASKLETPAGKAVDVVVLREGEELHLAVKPVEGL